MKYTLLGPNKEIGQIFDTPLDDIPDDFVVGELTDEQAEFIQNNRKTIYCLIAGEIKTLASQLAKNFTIGQCITAAETHIAKSFTSFILLDGLKRMSTAQINGTLATIPKTIAVATWVETVKQIALSGSTDFPPAPHTTEEVLSE